MHVQIVNFNLKGIADAQFREACDQLAPAFAAVPGLISKVWLADPSTNTYGGVVSLAARGCFPGLLGLRPVQGSGLEPQLRQYRLQGLLDSGRSNRGNSWP
jgi:hypothetical protein